MKHCLPAALLALLLAEISACQPVPQPFAHDGASKNPVITPAADLGGVTVLSVTGVPDAKARTLMDTMAKSLAEHEIPAATGTGNRLSRFTQASASVEPTENGQLRVDVVWDLFDRSGTLLGSHKVSRTVDVAEWERQDRQALRSLTDGAAAKMASLILNPSGKKQGLAAVPLHVPPVEGVPAGNELSLRQAMEAALRRRDFRVSPDPDDTGLVVAGQFSAGPVKSGRRPIEITWAVRNTAGRELGKLTQRNAVPVKDLQKGWKSLAAVIAENAAGGVSDLVRKIPAEALAELTKKAK